MTRAFNIYPALFILTPVMQAETIQSNDQASGNEIESNCEREGYFKSWPQTFWGDCLFNESHMQLVLRFSSDVKASPDQELLSGKLNALEPAKFKGKQYTITYIPVLN